MSREVKRKNFLIQVLGVYCDDQLGAIDCVIYGPATRILLKWTTKNNNRNVYPSDTEFEPSDIVFEVPTFDSSNFLDYVSNLKNRPKFFKDLNTNFRIRENMYTHGEDYLELKIKLNQKDKNIAQKMIDMILGFINKRIASSEVEEHMKEEYFRYFSYKDVKADSFTFNLDLGTGDIEELHNIFYLLDETGEIKSISVTLK